MAHNTVKLTLPLPPSANQMYRANQSGRGGAILKSQKARNYEKVCGFRISQQGKPEIARYDPLCVSMWFYLENRRRRDLDNLEKPLLDVVSRSLGFDDSIIEEKHSYKRYDKQNPRCELRMRTLRAKQ